LHGVLILEFDFDYARSVLVSEGEAIKALVSVVDGEFGRAGAMMAETSGAVIVSGMGKAGIIGEKISATLASTGTASHFLHPAEAIHGDLGRVQGADVVLALSHSGESDEIVRLVELVKQRQIRLIAITGNAESRLAKHSDIVLCMGVQEEACPLGIAPSVSTTCMLAIGDALAFMIMKARNFGAEEYARFHPGGAIGASLITVGQSMMFKPGEKLPVVKSADTVAVMFEKMRDVKRRGAVMVVDEGGQLCGIVTDGDLRRAVESINVDLFASGVAEIMTPDCKRVTEDTLAAEAMAIFHEFRIDELPVVDAANKPVGLIDVQDIVAIKISQ
jgi:arabinose-5-phosphate isomerase